MPFISNAGINLRYERAGQGRPLVFIHGLLCNHTFWDRQLPLRKSFQLLRLDLRGHGDSSKPKSGYGLTTMAEDVRHVVTALDLRDVVLVGWSMGGVVTQHALPLLSDRVAGIVLVGTTSCFTRQKGYAHGFKPEEAQGYLSLAEKDHRQFVRDLAGRLFKDQAELLPWATAEMMKTSPHAAVATLASLAATDLRDNLSSIECPTLICHGAHDAIFPLGAAEHMSSKIKGARLVTFDASGHAPMIEEHERFNSELTGFAESLSRA